MPMFRVHPRIWEAFPGLCLGVVTARGIDNRGGADAISGAARDVQQEIRTRFSMETLSRDPRIQAWRRTYASFGVKPKKYQSSVESLFRMTLTGRELRSINPVVDIANLVSLRHMVPVGGDDLDAVSGDIRLVFAEGGEPFTPLGRQDRETAAAGEVIYRDDLGVLCRRWNWRECERTKMTGSTRRICLVVEGLPPLDRGLVEGITGDLALLLEEVCGGETRSRVLDAASRDVGLSWS